MESMPQTELPLHRDGRKTATAIYAHNGSYSYFGIEQEVLDDMNLENGAYIDLDSAKALRDALNTWIAAKEAES